MPAMIASRRAGATPRRQASRQLHGGSRHQRVEQGQQPEAAARGEALAQQAPGRRADRRVTRQHPARGADPACGRLGRRRPEAGPAQKQLRVGLALQEVAVGVPEQIGMPVEQRSARPAAPCPPGPGRAWVGARRRPLRRRSQDGARLSRISRPKSRIASAKPLNASWMPSAPSVTAGTTTRTPCG